MVLGLDAAAAVVLWSFVIEYDAFASGETGCLPSKSTLLVEVSSEAFSSVLWLCSSDKRDCATMRGDDFPIKISVDGDSKNRGVLLPESSESLSSIGVGVELSSPR